MRLILGVLGLLLLFALVVWLAPPAWALPLYLLFLVAGVGYVLWERRRFGRRRLELERQLQQLESWGEEE